MTDFTTVRDFIERTYGVDGWLSDEAQEALAALARIEQRVVQTNQAGDEFLRSYLDASVSDEEGLLAALDAREWTAMWVTVDEKAQVFGRALAGPDTPPLDELQRRTDEIYAADKAQDYNHMRGDS